MIMNTAVAVAVTELFVTSRDAGSPFIVLAQCCRWKFLKNVLVSALHRRLDLGLARSRSRSRLVAKIRRLSLVELQEGLGLGFVSD